MSSSALLDQRPVRVKDNINPEATRGMYEPTDAEVIIEWVSAHVDHNKPEDLEFLRALERVIRRLR